MRILNSRYLVYAGFAVALLAAASQVPDRVRQFIQPILPVVQLWSNPEAQHRLHFGEVPYDVLRGADAVAPRDASILLVTPGRDVRHLDYTTFHRALYLLAPRPVWWLAPAPADGTWESHWWVSAPVDAESIRAVAREKQAEYVLMIDLAQPASLGRRVAEWPGGMLLQLNENAPLPSARGQSPEYAGAGWPLQMFFALAAIVLLGQLVLAGVARLGYRATGIEALALAWVFGGGLVSIGMLWLNAAGVSLNGQVMTLTLAAAVGGVYHARRNVLTSRQRSSASPDAERCWQTSAHLGMRTPRPWKRSALTGLLLAFGVLQLILVALMAAGQPLTGWDSWSSWGMRARTIFVEGAITPAVYADPSRASTLPYYPLFTPLLEAWLYTWLGAPDDRLVGVFSILFYLALAAVCYSAVRRRGASACLALSAALVVASMPYVTLLAGLVYVDVPLAVLMTIASVYFVDWLAGGSLGALALAALAAGLMPWVKREGWVLLVMLSVAALAASRGARRAWLGLSGLLASAAILSGPWWLFVARQGGANPDFLPITLATLQANLGRLLTIGRLAGGEVLSANWSFIWPVVMVCGVGLLVGRILPHPPSPSPEVEQHTSGEGGRRVPPLLTTYPKFSVAKSKGRRQERGQGGEALVLPIVAGLYLGLMVVSFVFSSFVPYQQHVLSSLYRLMAQVVALPVVWLAWRATAGQGVNKLSASVNHQQMDALESWRAAKVLPFVQGRLLDVGCGFNNLIRAYGAGTGVDIFPWAGVDVLIGDAAQLPFPDGGFDTVTVVAALNHIPNRAEGLAAVWRVLRPGGRLIVTMIGPLTGRLAHRVFVRDEQTRGGMRPDEKLGMTRREVVGLLNRCGFNVIREVPFQLSLNRVYVAVKDGGNDDGRARALHPKIDGRHSGL